VVVVVVVGVVVVVVVVHQPFPQRRAQQKTIGRIKSTSRCCEVPRARVVLDLFRRLPLLSNVVVCRRQVLVVDIVFHHHQQRAEKKNFVPRTPRRRFFWIFWSWK
jgi:hypothetical protein